jgi:anti-anti-sigma regulatory factor
MDPPEQPTLEISMFGVRCTILTVRGSLDGEVALAEGFLQAVVAAEPELFIVDLTGVECVPPEMIRAVLSAQEELRRRGHQLLIEGHDLAAGGTGSELDEAFAAYRRTVFLAGRHQKAG